MLRRVFGGEEGGEKQKKNCTKMKKRKFTQ